MDDCIFCKIIKCEIPSAKVYEDDKVFAFLDISPVNKGHTLILPKTHSKNMLETSDKELEACTVAAKIISKAILKATNADGINLIVNTHSTAGQAVFHTHMHLIPRFSGDGLKHWSQGKYSEGDMDKIKKEIVNNL